MNHFNPKYANANVEVWRQDQIAGFLNRFPSLAVQICGLGHIKFFNCTEWEQLDEMQRPYVESEERDTVIAAMRHALRRKDGHGHIRILGEAGVGKTRTALEVVKEEDLAPLVAYHQNARDYFGSSLERRLCEQNSEAEAILILDECDTETRRQAVNRLYACRSRVKVISIAHDYEPHSAKIDYIEIPPLPSDEISQILQSHGIPEPNVRPWIELCSGSPRVAHIIGDNLKHDPTRPATASDLWRRYIAGQDEKDSEQARLKRTLLQFLSLFKKFGYQGEFAEEGCFIHELVKKYEHSMSFAMFQSFMQDFRDRHILQGDYTLYISPKALHVQMWIEWWEHFGQNIDIDSFLSTLPNSCTGSDCLDTVLQLRPPFAWHRPDGLRGVT